MVMSINDKLYYLTQVRHTQNNCGNNGFHYCSMCADCHCKLPNGELEISPDCKTCKWWTLDERTIGENGTA